MSEDLHPIDDLFRSGLDGKEESPGPAVWDAIEKELDKKDRKPAGGFFRITGKAAAIALVLLGSAALFAAGYYLRGIQLAREQRKQQPATELPAKPAEMKELQPALKSPETTNDQEAVADQGTKISSATSDTRAALRDEQQPETRNPDTGDDAPRASANEKVTNKQPLAGKNTSAPNTGVGIQAKSANRISHKDQVPQPAVTQVNHRDPKGLAYTETTTKPQYPSVAREQDRVSRNWELATVESQTGSRQPVVPGQKIPSGSAQAQKSGLAHAGTAADKPMNQIPVANKKAAGLVVPRFTLTPYIAYQSHSMRLSDDGTHRGMEMKEDMEYTEQMPSKISGGILADIRIGNQLSLQTGLGYMQLDVQIGPKQIRAEKDIDGKVKYRLDCSAGTYFINPKQGSMVRPGDTISTRLATNSLNYLTIPLALKYHFGTAKLQLFATAGAGLNILASQSLNAMVNHQYQYYGGRTTNLRSNYFNGMIGAGATYVAGKRLGIYVSPQYNFALTSMNQGLPVKSLPRTFNLQAGITIKL